jgi:hypothetical protein
MQKSMRPPPGDRPPAMLRVAPLESDQLDIGVVRECNQRIVRAGRMRAAGNDGEAELSIVADRGAKIGNHDHEVIDRLQSHEGRSGRGNASGC